MKRQHNRTAIVVFLAGQLVLASSALAQVTLTMDDLPNQPIDGLVHPTGVTFGFTVDGVPDDDAEYNSAGPGMTANVDDPSIEGTNEGVMTIGFPEPVSEVSFGIALSTLESIENAVNVELFDGATLLFSQTLDVNLTDASIFPDALFQYDGAPITTLVVTPDVDVTAVGRFAFDNLTFVAVPEPTALACLGLAAPFYCGLRSRRRGWVG